MMKFYSLHILTLVLCAIFICGCEQRPTRKKLPDISMMQGWEEMPIAKKAMPPFFIYDTAVIQNGKPANFLCISIPDPAQDSMALTIAASYEPFASSLVQQWQKNNHKGFLIDLRSKDDNSLRADFLLNKNSQEDRDAKVSVVLLWNSGADYRANYFIKTIASFPEIKCNLISDSRKKEGLERTDCFSPTEPSFDQQ